jgi:uncharacterized protein involved in exopolysaccharide biosynthesis
MEERQNKMEVQTETYEDEINLLDYVKIILRNKMLICSIVGIVVVATVIVSFVMTPIYEAEAIIAPVAKSGDSSGAALLAVQFGISAPPSTNMSEIVNLLKSNVLREEVIRKHNLLPVFFEEKDLKGRSDNQNMWEGIRYLGDALKVNPNQKDNSIQVTMQFRDPKIAADIVNYTLFELTDHMSNEARRVADTNKKYLESQVDKTADPFIKTKIYALIAQQIETAMMAEVKENFAYKILDPPQTPDKKIKPKRTQMVLVAFIASLFLGIFAAFGNEYWKNHREELKEPAGKVSNAKGEC